jgi:flavin-binding protein dodecin
MTEIKHPERIEAEQRAADNRPELGWMEVGEIALVVLIGAAIIYILK